MQHQDALIIQVNSIRNQAIALVQQAEAVLQLLDVPAEATPVCAACGSARLKTRSTMGGEVTICLDCGAPQGG